MAQKVEGSVSVCVCVSSANYMYSFSLSRFFFFPREWGTEGMSAQVGARVHISSIIGMFPESRVLFLAGDASICRLSGFSRKMFQSRPEGSEGIRKEKGQKKGSCADRRSEGQESFTWQIEAERDGAMNGGSEDREKRMKKRTIGMTGSADSRWESKQ